jgi:hypothetical protein
MNDWRNYYEENLYHFQNGVLNCVKKSGTRFFLTGGTALSRGYFNHRYSDDIDLFLQNDDTYSAQVEHLFNILPQDGYTVELQNLIRDEQFTSFYLSSSDYTVKLKVDLVNDTAPRYGELIETPVYFRTDSWWNILSNKLCTLLRLAGKDYADLWILSKNRSFNWSDALVDARNKEAGLDPVMLVELMKSFPRNEFDSIRWINPPSWEDFTRDLEVMVYDIIAGEDNSLCKLILNPQLE